MKRIKLIIKWFKIIFGKSDLHVKQNVGKFYDLKTIKGYYNDLTHKINWSIGFDNKEIPLVFDTDNNEIYFPITIFQYGLGCYDKFLETNDKKYLKKFEIVVEWTLNNQDIDGGWDVKKSMGCKYSAMAQGQGISILSRAYTALGFNEKHLKRAKKAFLVMIKDVSLGGTTREINKKKAFEEYIRPHKDLVLNGWIFSLFGIYDYFLLTRDEKVLKIFDESVELLYEQLEKYDSNFWSYYNQTKKLASPFYHELHINLLTVLLKIKPNKNGELYLKKYNLYQKNKIFKLKAIILKICQKIINPGEIVMKN